MTKNILYLVGLITVLGGGAFLFLRNKKAKDTMLLADLSKEGLLDNVADNSASQDSASQDNTSQGNTSDTNVKVPEVLSANDLLATVALKEAIISEIRKRNSYKKASSKENVQTVINQKMAELNKFGFSLDTNNQLIKIR